MVEYWNGGMVGELGEVPLREQWRTARFAIGRSTLFAGSFSTKSIYSGLTL
jgi:hypothetical protein